MKIYLLLIIVPLQITFYTFKVWFIKSTKNPTKQLTSINILVFILVVTSSEKFSLCCVAEAAEEKGE